MNKNNMKHIYKFASIALLTGIVGLFTHCVPETTKIEAIDAPIKEVQAPKTEGEVLLALEVSSGVKSYEETLYTLSALTGVADTNANVRSVYNDVKVSLPTDSEMKSYLSGHQVALAKLAAEYCNEMINDVTLRQKIWNNANYALTKDVAFKSANPAVREELVTKLIGVFWGPSAAEEDKPELKQELLDLIDDLQEGEVNNTASTGIIVKGVCTAALSSMHVTVK